MIRMPMPLYISQHSGAKREAPMAMAESALGQKRTVGSDRFAPDAVTCSATGGLI
jgi:hypothetical protein